jgi:hypothetical protein
LGSNLVEIHEFRKEQLGKNNFIKEALQVFKTHLSEFLFSTFLEATHHVLNLMWDGSKG